MVLDVKNSSNTCYIPSGLTENNFIFEHLHSTEVGHIN